MWCNHNWEKIDKTVFPSIFDKMYDKGLEPISSITSKIFHTKVITIVSCMKCGKLKRFVDSIY